MEREECLESNSVRLSGTLTLPDEVGASFPACLFIGGGLPQTRAGDLDLAHTERFPIPLPQRGLFRDEADLLRQIGIASFRYDKRGCGKSTGDFNCTGLFDLLTDARHALHWMRCLPELDPQRIGLIGQSEGAIIALGLAAADSAIPFIVLQGGPYQDLKAILQWQAEAFWRQEEATINDLKRKVPGALLGVSTVAGDQRQHRPGGYLLHCGRCGMVVRTLPAMVPGALRPSPSSMGRPGEMPNASPPRRGRSQCARYRCQAAAGRLSSGRKYGCHPLPFPRPGSQFPSTWQSEGGLHYSHAAATGRSDARGPCKLAQK